MKAAALVGKKDIRLVEVPAPRAGRDGLVVRVRACGICGSDLHLAYNTEALTPAVAKEVGGYHILGHEYVGEVAEVGEAVTGWQVGDRVAVVHGRGGFAEYVHVPGDRLKDVYPIDPALSYPAASTLEPLCNGVHMFRVREPEDGETVAVFGAGPIGLGYLQAIKAYTLARVIVVDVSSLRLDVARGLGADLTINARQADPVQEIKSAAGEIPSRYGSKSAGRCDIAVDLAAQPGIIDQAAEVVRPDGTVILAGLYDQAPRIDVTLAVLKHLRLLTSISYTGEDVRQSIELISTGKAPRDLLVTHTFPLEQAAEAFQLAGDSNASIKVVLVND